MQENSNKPSHLKALLKKNWILWRRGWLISLCEILIPFLFALAMIWFRHISQVTDIPTTTYYNQPSTAAKFDATLNRGYIKNCNKREGGGLVAIVPDPSTDSLAFDVNQALSNFSEAEMRFLIFLIASADFKTKSFQNNKEIDDYTSQANYAYLSSKKETLCFAVVINKNDVNNQYEYMLRFNVSTFGGDLPNPANDRVDNVAL